MKPHRKCVRRFHEPGDYHELTFSCYRRLPLLTREPWCRLLAESVDRAMRSQGFRLIAHVFMPEHVHLLVHPTTNTPRLDLLLKAIKQPIATKVKRGLAATADPVLATLTVRERPGVVRFRLWQEGGGYDRNLRSEPAVLAAIDYIHLNPVRRGLCERAVDWRWSSASAYYRGRDLDQVENPPHVHGLPPEFFDSNRARFH